MKTYEIIIKPISGFATPLKGDTIFGQFCWQVAYNKGLCGITLDELLSDYEENPFVVISSAFPVNLKGGKKEYFLKRPDIPLEWIFGEMSFDEKKELKKKKFRIVSNDKRLNTIRDEKRIYHTDKKLYKTLTQWHNTINRITGKTGEDIFAPYSIRQTIYKEDVLLVIFAGIDEKRIGIEEFSETLEKIGTTGFGKDTSTGLGRFEVKQTSEIVLKKLGDENPNSCYTLSPCVPEKWKFKSIYFSPFVRFGKHGGEIAKKNPFKNPVIMADEGAILIPEKREVFEKPYIGTAVKDVSKIQKEAVSQGYSLYIPVRLE